MLCCTCNDRNCALLECHKQMCTDRWVHLLHNLQVNAWDASSNAWMCRGNAWLCRGNAFVPAALSKGWCVGGFAVGCVDAFHVACTLCGSVSWVAQLMQLQPGKPLQAGEEAADQQQWLHVLALCPGFMGPGEIALCC